MKLLHSFSSTEQLSEEEIKDIIIAANLNEPNCKIEFAIIRDVTVNNIYIYEVYYNDFTHFITI